jgi:membrane associated rhomboid family serine protease
MKRTFAAFFSSLRPGARWLLLAYALIFPVALIGHRTGWFDLFSPLMLKPALVWKGQLWRLLTYSFLAGGPLDWIVSLFWLATLVSVAGKHWSGWRLWSYCLMGALAGGLFIALLAPGAVRAIGSNLAMEFALLVAWDRIYRNERLILLGVGEISVRQAVILVAIIDTLIVFLCAGWFLTLAMWCGAAAGWLYFLINGRRLSRRGPELVASERMARLEL